MPKDPKLGALTFPWIDAAALNAEIAAFGPFANQIVDFVPDVGPELEKLLTILENPTIVTGAVTFINDIDGSTPPTPAPTPTPVKP